MVWFLHDASKSLKHPPRHFITLSLTHPLLAKYIIFNKWYMATLFWSSSVSLTPNRTPLEWRLQVQMLRSVKTWCGRAPFLWGLEFRAVITWGDSRSRWKAAAVACVWGRKEGYNTWKDGCLIERWKKCVWQMYAKRWMHALHMCVRGGVSS